MIKNLEVLQPPLIELLRLEPFVTKSRGDHLQTNTFQTRFYLLMIPNCDLTMSKDKPVHLCHFFVFSTRKEKII